MTRCPDPGCAGCQTCRPELYAIDPLAPQQMTQEQIVDLVERARANGERAKAEGIIKQAASHRKHKRK